MLKPMGTKPILGFALLGALLIANAFVSYQNIERLRDDVQWLRHSREVTAALDGLESSLKDAETGQRGFLITGEPSYLPPYDSAVNTIAPRLDHLKTLTEGDPVQRQRVAALAPLVAAKLAELDKSITLRRAEGREAARAMVISGEGKRIMDEIRARADEIGRTEEQLLADRRAKAQHSFTVATLSVLIASLLALALLAANALLTRRELRARARAAAEAHVQREWYETTLSSIGDAVIATDINGRITTMNNVAESLTGWRQLDAAGQPLDTVFNIVNETTRDRIEHPVAKVLESGQVQGLANHTVLIGRSGAEFAIDDSAAPIRDREGAIRGVVLVFRDITEKRKLSAIMEREHALFEAVLRQMPAGLTIADASSGKVVLGNDRLGAVLRDPGVTAGEFERYRRSKSFHLDGRPYSHQELPLTRALAMGEEIQAELLEVIRADDTRGTVEVNAGPVRNPSGEIIAAIATIQDVTERRQAEAALRESERLFARMAEATPNILFIYDIRTRRNVYVNGLFERLLGHPGNAIQSKDRETLDLVHPDDRDTVAREHERLTASPDGEVVMYEFRIRHADGDYRWLCTRATVFTRDDRGAVLQILGASEDITQRKLGEDALRESRAQMQFILDAARVGYWDLDLVSGEAERTLLHDRCFGATEAFAHWSFDTFSSYVHPDDRVETVRKFQAALAGKGDWSFECRVIWPDQSVHWIGAHGSVYRFDGERPLRMLGIVMDITERKAAEDALREADRRKDEFLAMLSHELRNPLAPITNAVEIMRRVGDVEPKVDRARELIDSQVKVMVHLVDDLLDVSRVTQGKISLRKTSVPVQTIVEQALETSRPLIEGHGHRLAVALPEESSDALRIHGDPVRLVQVLTNLLNNAAKYTREGGAIELSARREGRDGNEVALRVRDNGMGIGAETLPHIFDLFSQADRSLARAEGGLGIGLTLVKSLVEMHGGTVEAHSEGLGHGSEFVIRLPLEADSASSLAPPRLVPSAASTAVYRILVVDDNAAAGEAISTLLEMDGHTVRRALDGPTGLALVAEFEPELIICDIGLPGMTGYEVIQALREQIERGGKPMPVVAALTGYGQAEDFLQSRKAGFDYHLVKPTDADALIALVASLSSRDKPASQAPRAMHNVLA